MKTLIPFAAFCSFTMAFAQPNPPEVVAPTPSTGHKITVPSNLESAIHMRDPFRRFIPKKSKEDDEALAKSEMESLAVDQFKLVGVITGPRKHKALLSSPNGKIHIVSEGAKIGPRKGIIRKVSAQKIWIEETVINLLGEEERIQTEIELYEKTAKPEVVLSSASQAPQQPPNQVPSGGQFQPQFQQPPQNFMQPPFQGQPTSGFPPRN